MQLQDVDVIKELFTVSEVNQHLHQGWRVVSVLAVANPEGTDLSVPCYVMGRDAQAKLNHPKTLQMVRHRIDVLRRTAQEEHLLVDIGTASGWINALFNEGLIDGDHYHVLDDEIDEALKSRSDNDPEKPFRERTSPSHLS